MNAVVQVIHSFYLTFPILFWLVAIIGFPEIEIVALVTIAIASFAH